MVRKKRTVVQAIGLTNYTVSEYPIISVVTPFALSGFGMPVCNPNNIDQKAACYTSQYQFYYLNCSELIRVIR